MAPENRLARRKRADKSGLVSSQLKGHPEQQDGGGSKPPTFSTFPSDMEELGQPHGRAEALALQMGASPLCSTYVMHA